MFNMHPNDLLAVLSRVAGLSILVTDTTFVSSINSLFGHYGPIILGVIGLVTTLAADVIRINSVPTGSVVQKITTNTSEVSQ